jgi:putative DNA primase/helicase
VNQSKENGSASPQSQPAQKTLSNTINFTGDRLQSPTDGLFHLACGDGVNMGQVTEWTTNWDDFSESLSVPEVGEKRGPFWCAADYGGRTKRIHDNVQGVSLIVLDVEAKAKQPPPLADALALCETRGWQAFGHTTYTHTPEAPRYRLCMAPSRTIKPEELRRLIDAVAQELDLECACDLPASGDSARLYYTPRVACEADRATFEHGAVEGATVDVDEMLASGKPEFVKPAPAPALVKGNGQLMDDLRAALEFLDPDPYDEWTDTGHALKTAPLVPQAKEELYHEWSEKSAKYNRSECQATWESFKPTRTSYKAIFKKAMGLGWVNPASGFELIARGSNSQDMLAETFAQRYEGALAYAHDFGAWLEFNGFQWIKDPTRKAFEYARQLCRELGDGKQTTRAAFFSGVEQIAKCDPRLSCGSGEFDCDNYELNTPSGLYDLRTGEVKPHHPGQRLTKITAVAPTAAHGGVFLKAIREICGGDESLVRFHQVSLGAMLSGAREEHWLVYWFGTGRNGKNLLADLVCLILGEYAHKLPSSALMSKKHESHPSELTGLRGVRLALSSEIEEGSFWNEARLKELTGDERITARYMGRDAFTFIKTHKHLILGNHRPQIKTVDEAIKNRVLLVPFDVSFAGREDRDLPQKIRAEAGFVLHWLLEGHKAWLENGKRLPQCEAVQRATKGYFAAQSTIEMWIDECCRKVNDPDRPAGGWCSASELYENYQHWKRARGETPVSQTRFGESMGRTFVKAQSKKAAVYVGLEIERAGVMPMTPVWTR